MYTFLWYLGVLIIIFISACIIGAVAVKVYLNHTCGRYNLKKSLKGKVVLITGATDGIGKSAAKLLALHGASVHIPARNLKKADLVKKELQQETGNQNIFVYEMDLCDFQSIRNFARQFLQTRSSLHILINNAGICPWSKTTTKDGLSEVMQTNHFGPFLLTQLLMDRILDSGPGCRIVTTTSRHFSRAKSVDFDDLFFEKSPYAPMIAYSWTKIFNIWYTRELARRYHGRGITVNCCHPGFVATPMTQSATKVFHWVKVAILFARSPDVAAETLMHLACADELENVSGHYFRDCKHAALTNLAINDKLAQKMWTLSERITGLST